MKEENTYSIYKFTFSDGKTYIGQTSQKVEDRWKDGEGYKGQDVYVPIVVEGWDNIKKEILHTGLSQEQADSLEKHYIKKYDSIKNGYNRSSGITHNKRNNEIIDDLERLEKLTNELIEAYPILGEKNNPNKILTLQELFSLSRENPDLEVIHQGRYCIPSIYNIKKWSEPIEVCPGGLSEYYLWQYLVDWRIWIGNPDIKTMLAVPWADDYSKQITEYSSVFIRDKKVKKFYLQHNEYPCTYSPGFKNYFK